MLVHQYTEVDDRPVLAALGRLGVFRTFVTEVSAWLVEARPPEEGGPDR